MNIGESPVSSITGTISVDAATALALVRNTTREIQTHGFYWNTEVNYTISPNAEKKLQLPANTLQVDTTGDHVTDDLVARGQYLYDRVNHTYEFDDSVEVELVVALNFEEMPEAARRYVTVRSSRIYQERVMATPTLSSFNTADEDFARAQLLAENISVEDNNMLTDSYGISYTLGRINY